MAVYCSDLPGVNVLCLVCPVSVYCDRFVWCQCTVTGLSGVRVL